MSLTPLKRYTLATFSLGIMYAVTTSVAVAIPVPSMLQSPASMKTLKQRQNKTFFTNVTGPQATKAGFEYPREDARMHDGDEVRLFSSTHKRWFALAVQNLSSLRGEVSLVNEETSSHCGLDAQSPRIMCNIGAIFSSVQVEVRDAGGGRVGLLVGGKYCSDRPEGIRCAIDSMPKGVAGWEAFKLVEANHSAVNLIGGRLGKVCSSRTIGIVCDRDVAQGPEDRFAISAINETLNGLVVQQTSDGDRAAVFKVRRKGGQASAKSTLECVGQGTYLSKHPHTKKIGCFSTSPVELDYVRLNGQTWWDDAKGAFRDPTSGKFFRAEGPQWGDHIDATGTEASGWQLFTIHLVAGYETIYPVVRGVNLGSWFLLEQYMAQHLFKDNDGKRLTGNCTPIDERGLMKQLNASVSKERMEVHWGSWITEQDIAWIASHGLNTVRVPLGYWVTHPEPPFVEGAFKHLARFFKWCERHHLSVILDFRGLKGSQNGATSSGNCGACGRNDCGTTWVRFLDYKDTNLAVIANLSRHFAQSPSYLGFGVANEVASSVDGKDVMAFYQKAYDTIRQHSTDTLVFLGGTFNPSTYPFQGEQGIVQESHIYYNYFKDGASINNYYNIKLAQHSLSEVKRWPVLVTEWSLQHDGGRMGFTTQHDENAWLPKFAQAQLQAYEQHSMGWIFWSYKTHWRNTHRDFKDMCSQGFLPECTASKGYASDTWWNGQRPCKYAYLDGVCTESG